jgi:putative flavoprotein involved in K+ transport
MYGERYEVIIIGGGQAGLAMGQQLARQGRRFVILDAAPRVGHSWRTRWDSLTLFTPARYSSLPGLAVPGDPEHYPRNDEVADYLELYATTFDLPIRLGEAVELLRPLPDSSGFEVLTAGSRYEADQVVVATGPFQRPFIPRIAQTLSPDVAQLHSSAYLRPEQLPTGDVLVVGAGNSGVQIAAEIAPTRRTTLSVGQRLPRLPQRAIGRSIFWWLEKSGLMDVTVESRLGSRMSQKDALIGGSPAIVARDSGVRLTGRVEAADENAIRTSGGDRLTVAAVVWATGFRSDYRWIKAPVLDPRGDPIHRRGVSALRGLYFLGLPWQHTRGSALIGWVGRDAEFLAGRIAAIARDPITRAAPAG